MNIPNKYLTFVSKKTVYEHYVLDEFNNQSKQIFLDKKCNSLKDFLIQYKSEHENLCIVLINVTNIHSTLNNLNHSGYFIFIFDTKLHRMFEDYEYDFLHSCLECGMYGLDTQISSFKLLNDSCIDELKTYEVFSGMLSLRISIEKLFDVLEKYE